MKVTSGVRCVILGLLLVLIGACGDDDGLLRPPPTPTAIPSEVSVIPHLPVPQHPYLAPNGKSNMHNDAYMTDTYEVSGPVGKNPEVMLKSYARGNNLCVTNTFDRKGRILTVNARMSGFSLLLIDPDTLEQLASFLLPPKHITDPLYPYRDTSGGAYFVLDSQDQVLLADSDNALQVIRYRDDNGAFELVRKYDLSTFVVPMTAPAMDHVQMAIPDWSGQLWWFATRFGKVGTLDPQSGAVHTIELVGEEMENSFTIGEEGAYIVTDYAMYRFHADQSGLPQQDWRTPYDRGTQVKPGNINQGSGTTPKLFGDMVAIADNAEPRMNILFMQRSDGREVCRIPVFEEGRSTTENAMPGWVRQGPKGREYSLIVENNYGKKSEQLLSAGGPCAESVGGVTRIDMVPDGSGGYSCKEVWTSPEDSCSTVPKVSLTNGLVYLYTFEHLLGTNYDWHLTALDVATGQTVLKTPTGAGITYTDFGAPITLGPDGKTVYIGTMGGMTRIRDLGP